MGGETVQRQTDFTAHSKPCELTFGFLRGVTSQVPARSIARQLRLQLQVASDNNVQKVKPSLTKAGRQQQCQIFGKCFSNLLQTVFMDNEYHASRHWANMAHSYQLPAASMKM